MGRCLRFHCDALVPIRCSGARACLRSITKLPPRVLESPQVLDWPACGGLERPSLTSFGMNDPHGGSFTARPPLRFYSVPFGTSLASLGIA